MFKIKYDRYNNSDFGGFYFAETIEEAQEKATKLSTLNFVSNIRIEEIVEEN